MRAEVEAPTLLGSSVIMSCLVCIRLHGSRVGSQKVEGAREARGQLFQFPTVSPVVHPSAAMSDVQVTDSTPSLADTVVTQGELSFSLASKQRRRKLCTRCTRSADSSWSEVGDGCQRAFEAAASCSGAAEGSGREAQHGSSGRTQNGRLNDSSRGSYRAAARAEELWPQLNVSEIFAAEDDC